MSLMKARARTTEEPKQDEQDQSKCKAYGCPCRATVNLAGSGWACYAHAFAAADSWPDITRGLRSHDWILGLVAQIRSMERAYEVPLPKGQTHPSWREFAMRFWADSDPYCQPRPFESATPYCDRMLYELLHRIGLRKTRPEPREAAKTKPAGRFASSATKEFA